MPRPTKYQSKVQEAVFRLVIVPLLFVLGIYIVSDIISEKIGGEVFRWFLFGGGTIGALVFYFKKNLQEISW